MDVKYIIIDFVLLIASNENQFEFGIKDIFSEGEKKMKNENLSLSQNGFNSYIFQFMVVFYLV